MAEVEAVSDARRGRVRNVSIIAPMFNEAAYIEQFVTDVAQQDFEGESELIVADGRSTDDSVPRLTEACDRAGIQLTLVDNPGRWVSHGLNACIRLADSDLIVRMDCHTLYPREYLTLIVRAVEETGAWNVGGRVVPVGRTTTERAVAAAMDSPFGGVHWTRRANARSRVEVDMVHCGAYRPIVFERAGLFDEGLVRNQDDDLAFRIRHAGGKVLLDPAIQSHYIPRGSYRRVFRQYFEYGVWKVALMRKHRRVISGRSLAPAALIASLSLLAVLSPIVTFARWLGAAELLVYGIAATAFGVAAVRNHRESLRLVPRTTAVYLMFHFGYGIGIVAGLLRRPRATSGSSLAVSAPQSSA